MKKSNHIPKPDWLKIKLGDNSNFTKTKHVVDGSHLNTICTSGKCPNLGECWGAGTATFMICGDVCTRACKFCNTKSSKKPPMLDPDEPNKIAYSVKALGLKHVVITSVDRDDLDDFGANHWVETIKKIKEINEGVTIEVLIPDFNGNLDFVDMIIDTKPNVISHNLETVKRLTPTVRHIATYENSLKVLEKVAKSGIITKTGIMLGLGETQEEVVELMDDIKSINVSVLTIGQYLQPTRKHLPVVEYIHPKQFANLRNIGIQKGIRRVESGPLVRSSYHAEKHF